MRDEKKQSNIRPHHRGMGKTVGSRCLSRICVKRKNLKLISKSIKRIFLRIRHKTNPHPYGMRLDFAGLSHGLKTCHRHVFLTAFRVPPQAKNSGHPIRDNPNFGAGGGTRTHTMSPPKDFESSSSTIPTHRQGDINTLTHTSLRFRRDMQEGY